MANVLRTGVSVREQEIHIERPNGSRGIALVDIEAVKDSSGNIVGAVNCFQDIAERRRNEEAALRLAAIIESSDDAIVSKDLDGIITSWNYGAQRVFGYTAEEVVGKPITIVIPPDRHNEEAEILERLRSGERIESYETVRRHKDGRLIDFSVTVSPVKNANGRIIGASKIARDITERVRAEKALQESEARLSAILNQVPGAVGMFGHDGRFVLRGGPLSVLWDEVIPSRDQASSRRWRGFDANGGVLPHSQYPGARALRGETVAPGLDFIHTADDGRETWIRVSATPFRDGVGRISGAVAILQNVDDEKRAEQRLRESEMRLQTAVDLVKLGRYAWNPQTNELQWDDTLRAMWGLPADASPDTMCGVLACIQTTSCASMPRSSGAPTHGAMGCTISSTE
jgi:PAS domain S-box-containing protein